METTHDILHTTRYRKFGILALLRPAMFAEVPMQGSLFQPLAAVVRHERFHPSSPRQKASDVARENT